MRNWMFKNINKNIDNYKYALALTYIYFFNVNFVLGKRNHFIFLNLFSKIFLYSIKL